MKPIELKHDLDKLTQIYIHLQKAKSLTSKTPIVPTTIPDFYEKLSIRISAIMKAVAEQMGTTARLNPTPPLN